MRIFTLTRKIVLLATVCLLLIFAASAFSPLGQRVAAQYLPLPPQLLRSAPALASAPMIAPLPPPPAMTGCATPSFGVATNFAVGHIPNSVAVGDLNGDGKLDLAVANQSSDNVSVLLGNGLGGFAAATNFAGGLTLSPWRWAISMAMASLI